MFLIFGLPGLYRRDLGVGECRDERGPGGFIKGHPQPFQKVDTFIFGIIPQGEKKTSSLETCLGGLDGKEYAQNVGDLSLIPGSG